jgi:hypothetical protein
MHAAFVVRDVVACERVIAPIPLTEARVRGDRSEPPRFFLREGDLPVPGLRSAGLEQ